MNRLAYSCGLPATYEVELVELLAKRLVLTEARERWGEPARVRFELIGSSS